MRLSYLVNVAAATFTLVCGIKNFGSILDYSAGHRPSRVTSSSPRKVGFSDRLLSNRLLGCIKKSPSHLFTMIGSITDVIKSIPREVKSYTSSDLESLLLQCTMPTNRLVDDEFISKLIFSVKSFDELSELYDVDAYDVITQKLIAKMHEKDWRTVAKSIFILHRLLQEVTPAQKKIFCQHFMAHISQTLSIHLQRQKIEVSPGKENPWDWIVAYMNHMDTLFFFGIRDQQNIQDVISFQGPAPLLRLICNHLDGCMELLSKSLKLSTSIDSSFVSSMTLSCNTMVRKDVVDMLHSLSVLESPTDGGYLCIEQGAIDELQYLAKEAIMKSSSIQALLRSESDYFQLQGVSSSKVTSTSTIPSTCSDIPPLPSWVHDMYSMSTGISLGPLRMYTNNNLNENIDAEILV